MKNTRKIDRRAQKVFQNLLPDEWLPREMKPDIHVDYSVEIADQDPTGETFYVQLKGREKPRYKGNKIKLRMKNKHLTYYLNKLKLPVFIVIVDTKDEKAFWVFIQECLRAHPNIDLSSGDSTDIEIPLDNDLSDTSRLISAVQSAETFMRELWPSSVHAAAQHTKQRYEQIDRRFIAEVGYADGNTTCVFRAKEPVEISLGFDPSDMTKKKMVDVFERGVPTRFTANEITAITGTPLFEDIQKTAKLSEVVLKPETRDDVRLNLSAFEPTGLELAALNGIQGAMSRGRTEAHYEGNILKTPFSIRITFPLFPSHNHQCRINITFESSKWDGLSILNLPYFDKLHQFYRAVHEGCQLRMAFEIGGQDSFTISSPHGTGKGILGQAVQHLTLIDKVRNIFRKYNKDSAYPDGGFINRADRYNIELIHSLITDGKLHSKGGDARFVGKLEPREDMPNFDELQSKVIYFKAEADKNFQILGQKIEFGSVTYTLTHPELSRDSRNLSQQEIENGINFEAKGTEGSELIISKG
jgi:hypothetical protein